MKDTIMTTANLTVAATPKEDTVAMAFEKMKPQFAAALPKHITPERMVRVALTAIQNTPKLLECDRKSLLMAVLRAAQLGLEPDGVLGQAYLIPFGNQVQFIAGYKGLIDLARRSGEVTNIIAKEVYANDEFSVNWAATPPFIHKPKLGSERGEVILFWAMANFKDGGFHWDYMERSEVEAIRNRSQGYKSAIKYNKLDTPWITDFNEMGKKTVIRRIAKFLPMSVQKAAFTEDLIDAGKKFHIDDFGEIIIDQEPAPPAIEGEKTTGNEGLKSKLAKKAGAAGADPETGEIQAAALPVFSTKEILAKWQVADATQPDFEAWKLEFMTMCNTAPTLILLAEFVKQNEPLLNKYFKLAPSVFEACMACHKDNSHRLASMDS